MLYGWIIGACLLSSNVYAEPTCKIYGPEKTTVVCKPGVSYYTLERGLVSDHSTTRKIVLRNCRISDIGYEAFANLISLRHLDLSRNNIQYLAVDVFNGLTKMNHLNLSFNSIIDLSLDLFQPIPNLLNLDLSTNRFKSFDLGIVRDTKLKVLNVSSNLLMDRHHYALFLEGFPNINHLDLSRIDLSDALDNFLYGFKYLEYLNLENTLLAGVPKFATAPNLRTMKHLVLSTNQIWRIDDKAVFVNLDSLEFLNLEKNDLEFINEQVFKPLRKLKGIVLRDNKLIEISTNLFQNLPKLVNLDLANNYFESFSVDVLKGTSLKNLNLSGNSLMYMPEKFCLQLRKMGVILSKFFFSPIPWQCACLNELLKEVKYFNIEYNSRYFDGKHPVCTFSGKFLCRRSYCKS